MAAEEGQKTNSEGNRSAELVLDTVITFKEELTVYLELTPSVRISSPTITYSSEIPHLAKLAKSFGSKRKRLKSNAHFDRTAMPNLAAEKSS
jgi:hypothetical protein